MKAEITKNGKLILTPQSDLEAYALNCFKENMVNGGYYEYRTPEAIDENIIIQDN